METFCVVKFKLYPKNPIGFETENIGGLTLEEITNYAIVSLAIPDKNKKVLSKSIFSYYGLNLPDVGKSSISEIDDTRILGIQPSQYFIIFQTNNINPKLHIEKVIKKLGYLTDQSDSWSLIKLTGIKSKNALARICPINLNDEAFKVNDVARTSMEYIGVIIIKLTSNEFLLLSPRSSAHSFYHSIKTSADNIL